MQIQNSSFPPFHSISTIIFVLIIIFTSPTSFCQGEDELFFNCSSIFSCGENFPNITYPFWGGNKSQECGLEGFYLTCHQDDHLTIDIADQTFRVLSIHTTTYVLRIARDDLWDNVCPENYSNTSINAPLFLPGQGVEKLTLHYGCPPNELQPRNTFSCTNNSGNARNDFSSDGVDCESNISVLVLQRELEEFGYNESMTLRELLYQGFNVGYSLEGAACSACVFSGGLCWSGTNSTTPSCLCPDGSREHFCPVGDQGRRISLGLRIAIGVGTAASVPLIALFIYFIYRFQSFASNLRMETKENKNLEVFIRQYGSVAPKRYSYSDIKKMTNSFKDELGQGGYGTVYKGKLSDGHLVAVKILNVSNKGNGEEFINEVLSISRTSHVNVVMFLGFCFEGKRRALVHEYMPNGSLEKYIHAQENSKGYNQLGQDKLYQISLGVARGLEYLHQRCNTRILHFDIKPHNILLDEDFCPKISDFGLAKQCMKKESIVSILGARGTIGYIAPELVCRSFGGVSYKSDVYSYGMMILEIVGKRKNVNPEMSQTSEIYFPHWAYQHLIVDEDLKLKEVVSPEEDEIARKIILVGLWCIQSDPSQRPTMSNVIEMLEGSSQAIEIPPKAFFGFPSTPPQASSAITIVVS